MANSPSGQSVVHRVARILQCFDAERQDLSGSDLARLSGLSPSTAHRLAVEMAQEGLLLRAGRGRFRIGIGLWEASQRGSVFREFAQTALPFMEAVHVTLRQNVSLSVLDVPDRSIVYLERLSHHGAREDLTQVAIRQPVLAASAGLVMLAFSPPAVQEAVLRSPWDPATAASGTTEQQLRRRLAQARTEGHLELRGVLVPNLSAVSAPVLDAQGGAIAAIAVVQSVDDVNLPAQVPALVSAARALSRVVVQSGLAGRVRASL